jgi:predicted Rossmann-fold nucleotide-binding protein
MTRVLVCGGRDYADYNKLYDAIFAWDATHSIALVINGGASGADEIARKWAESTGKRCVSYPAKWEEHGRAAGPIRNQLMLDKEKPDVVIAAPGGRGTADMVKRARAAGVKVIEVE